MRLSSLFVGGVLLVAASVTACADRHPVAMNAAWSLAPSLETSDAEAPPDSGEVVVYPQDGPGLTTDATEGAASFRMAAAEAGDSDDPPSSPAIRIGVVQSATEVLLGSEAPYIVRDKATSLTLMEGDGSTGPVTVTLASAPPQTFWRLQVTCSNATTVAARKATAEGLGHVTFTEFFAGGNCTRLYLGQFDPPPANTTAARNAYRSLVINQGLADPNPFYRQVTVPGPTVYHVARGGVAKQSINPPVITSANGLVTISGVTYRGKGEARLSGASLAGINELPMEHYLYGVVPRELGPVAFPEIEAQKAQAVAARTYAIANFNKRSGDGYSLRATTDDQVYGGYTAEHPVSSAAVDQTRGLVATFGKIPITANYHSTSGGHTADNEESFVGVGVDYLRGVPDAQRGRALDHASLAVFKAHANPTSLRAAKEGDFESDWARLHRWTFEWTMAEMSDVISDLAPDPVGKVTAIEVLSRGPSGRVIDIKYVTEAGEFIRSRGEIRSSLRFIDASGVKSNLPSTLFFIEPIIDPKTKETVGYRAYGGGFGHGVGLSQTGAVGMAQKGHDFKAILKHYYRGIDLAEWY